MDDEMTLRRIRNELRRQQFRHADEAELETGIETVLAGLGLPVQRQVRLDGRSRIDLTAHMPRPAEPIVVGLEVKVDGSAGAVRRQVLRYAAVDTLGALILVTTLHRHMVEVMPYATEAPAGNPAGAKWLLAGKPFELVLIRRGLL